MNSLVLLRRIIGVSVLLVGTLFLRAEDKSTTKEPAITAPASTNKWQSLFDGKTLTGWKITNFGANGEVKAEDQQIKIDMGGELTGLSYTNTGLPKVDYEIELDAKKVDGNDFFCGLTFPVSSSFCSLIVGGWGGSVVGLSSLDGMDASENDTTKSRYFEKNKWFHIRVRVEAERIHAWIDDDHLIDVTTKDRKVAVRAGDIELSKPLGIATWQTSAAIKNIRVRKI
jgi:hypothetical protein